MKPKKFLNTLNIVNPTLDGELLRVTKLKRTIDTDEGSTMSGVASHVRVIFSLVESSSWTHNYVVEKAEKHS